MDQSRISGLIARRVLSARRGAGWTRRQLAGEAGISERYLAKLEKGQANVSIAVLMRVAGALSIEGAALFAPLEEASSADAGDRDGLGDLLASLTVRERATASDLIRRHIDAGRRALSGIALIGLRGAGKSTLGRMLAERFGLEFVRLTGLIEAEAGMSVAEIFSLGGDAAYRRHEREVVARLVARREFCVVETSGGLAANRDAYRSILAHTRCVWLKASAREHMARVIAEGDLRPMAGHGAAMAHLEALLAAREPAYAEADFTIDTSGRTEEDCFRELCRYAAPVIRSATAGTPAGGRKG